MRATYSLISYNKQQILLRMPFHALGLNSYMVNYYCLWRMGQFCYGGFLPAIRMHFHYNSLKGQDQNLVLHKDISILYIIMAVL